MRWSVFACCAEDDFNMLCSLYSARMPASPFQDKEALKEVQKAPQETIPLQIGRWFRRNMTWSCCSRAWSVLFRLCRQGSESEDEDYHKKKKRSQSKSPSERSSSGESGEWPSRSEPQIRGLISVSNIYWYFQREAIKSPRSTRRRPRRGVTSL